MKTRTVLVLSIFFISAVVLPALAASAATPEDKPNVILFLVDDMGWMDSTPYGSTYYDTPNMDRLAKRGMRFTDAYATPLCSPTRASILTGKYSARHGITTASGHQPPHEAGFEHLADEAPAGQRMVMPVSRFMSLSYICADSGLRPRSSVRVIHSSTSRRSSLSKS